MLGEKKIGKCALFFGTPMQTPLNKNLFTKIFAEVDISTELQQQRDCQKTKKIKSH